MGKKIIIEAKGFSDPFIGTFTDKKLGLIFLVVYKPETRKAIVSLYDSKTELAATHIDGRVLRIDDAAATVERAAAIVNVPYYKPDYTISLLGRFHKLIPWCADPKRAHWEKGLNKLQPGGSGMSAKEFMATGREAFRLFASMR